MTSSFRPSSPPLMRRLPGGASPRSRGAALGILAAVGALLALTQSGGPPHGWLAYASTADGDYDIYLIGIDDDSEPVQLTNSPGADAEPEWSPDGARLLFSSERDGNTDVFVMNADGSDQINLTSDPAEDGGPVWSPECFASAAERCTRRIAFHSSRGGTYDLYVMNEFGGEVFQITRDPGDEMWPTWSPDGEKLAYMAYTDANGWDIDVITIATGEVQHYTESPGIDDFWPEWSPDGGTIAWIGYYTSWYRVWLMSATCTPTCGGNKHLLIPDQGEGIGVPENDVHEFDPNWSPDSQWVTFSSYRDPASTNPVQQVQFDYEIFIARTDGTGIQQITFNDLIDDFTPAWTFIRPPAFDSPEQ